jgi:hypothetical protein
MASAFSKQTNPSEDGHPSSNLLMISGIDSMLDQGKGASTAAEVSHRIAMDGTELTPAFANVRAEYGGLNGVDIRAEQSHCALELNAIRQPDKSLPPTPLPQISLEASPLDKGRLTLFDDAIPSVVLENSRVSVSDRHAHRSAVLGACDLVSAKTGIETHMPASSLVLFGEDGSVLMQLPGK